MLVERSQFAVFFDSRASPCALEHRHFRFRCGGAMRGFDDGRYHRPAFERGNVEATCSTNHDWTNHDLSRGFGSYSADTG